jgi:hypothetical protein
MYGLFRLPAPPAPDDRGLPFDLRMRVSPGPAALAACSRSNRFARLGEGDEALTILVP